MGDLNLNLGLVPISALRLPVQQQTAFTADVAGIDSSVMGDNPG
jgi:hypothetical protein